MLHSARLDQTDPSEMICVVLRPIELESRACAMSVLRLDPSATWVRRRIYARAFKEVNKLFNVSRVHRVHLLIPLRVALVPLGSTFSLDWCVSFTGSSVIQLYAVFRSLLHIININEKIYRLVPFFPLQLRAPLAQNEKDFVDVPSLSHCTTGCRKINAREIAATSFYTF